MSTRASRQTCYPKKSNPTERNTISLKYSSTSAASTPNPESHIQKFGVDLHRGSAVVLPFYPCWGRRTQRTLRPPAPSKVSVSTPAPHFFLPLPRQYSFDVNNFPVNLHVSDILVTSSSFFLF